MRRAGFGAVARRWLAGPLVLALVAALLAGPASVAAAAPASAQAVVVTLDLTGSGSGTVTSSPAGLSCSGAAQTCTGTFAPNTVVTLSASPAGGHTFAGWGGACTGTGPCTVTLATGVLVAATFHGSAAYVFYHQDAIGSVRAVTNEAGATVATHDYQPFGEDTQAPTGDPIRFAGKERDSETELHYFGARYYRQTLGRFSTVDPGHVGGHIDDPQSWNAYAYARNNPLRFVDPDGREYLVCGVGGGCGTVSDQYFDQLSRSSNGFDFRHGNIWATGSGAYVYAGWYRQTSVDATLEAFISQTGELAGRWLGDWLTELGVAAITGATGGLAAGVWSGGLALAGLEAPVMTRVANVTAKGARTANLAVDLSAREFQANLVKSGYKVIRQGMGSNGRWTMLGNGDKTYTIYTATTTGGPAAEVRVAGRLVSKIRLVGF